MIELFFHQVGAGLNGNFLNVVVRLGKQHGEQAGFERVELDQVGHRANNALDGAARLDLGGNLLQQSPLDLVDIVISAAYSKIFLALKFQHFQLLYNLGLLAGRISQIYT